MKRNDFWAIGYFTKDGDFIIDSALYSADGQLICQIVNNEVDMRTENLQQLNTIDDEHKHNIEVIDKNGSVVLNAQYVGRVLTLTDGTKLPSRIVEIFGQIYDKSGRLVASGDKNGLAVNGIKGVIGATKNGALGMVLGCTQEEIAFIRNFAKEHMP